MATYDCADRLRHRGLNPFRKSKSTKNTAEAEPADRNTEIALFRFGLIAQIVHTMSDKVRQEGILRETAARSNRIPRSTNPLCATALMAGLVDQQSVLEESMLRKATADLDRE